MKSKKRKKNSELSKILKIFKAKKKLTLTENFEKINLEFSKIFKTNRQKIKKIVRTVKSDLNNLHSQIQKF